MNIVLGSMSFALVDGCSQETQDHAMVGTEGGVFCSPFCWQVGAAFGHFAGMGELEGVGRSG